MGADQGDNEVLEIEAIEDQEHGWRVLFCGYRTIYGQLQARRWKKLQNLPVENPAIVIVRIWWEVEVNRGLSSVDTAYT